MINNKDIGNYGEDLAVRFLINNCYIILERNYRNKIGEIDIVCIKENIMVFIEVKSRYTNTFGYPMESITYYKQKQILKISSIYMLSKKFSKYNVRYDVIEVIFNKINNNYIINHITDAFRQ